MYMSVVPGLLVGVLTMGAGAVSDAFFFSLTLLLNPFLILGYLAQPQYKEGA